MKKLLVGTIAALALYSPALAQSSDSSSVANQHTDATAANTVNVVAVAQGPTGPQRSDVNYSGHTWTTPNVAGSYFGGTNPCLIGTGGGAAGGPIGFNINIGKSDEGCTRRSDAAAWHGMGFSNVAIARMCQDTKSADAFFSATGYACPGTRGERYRLADGSLAPEMTLVATSKAIPENPNVGLDMNDPNVQRAVRDAAEQLIRNNPQAAMSLLKQAPVTEPEERKVVMVSEPLIQSLNNH